MLSKVGTAFHRSCFFFFGQLYWPSSELSEQRKYPFPRMPDDSRPSKSFLLVNCFHSFCTCCNKKTLFKIFKKKFNSQKANLRAYYNIRCSTSTSLDLSISVPASLVSVQLQVCNCLNVNRSVTL